MFFNFFNKRKKGITLVETLMVMAIVGMIVALLIIVTKVDFMAIRSKQLNSQKLSTLQNFKQTMGTMHSENRLAGLSDTDDYISAMGKYAKLKVVDNDEYSYIKDAASDLISLGDDYKTVMFKNGAIFMLEYEARYKSSSRKVTDETVCDTLGNCIITNETFNYVKGIYDVNGKKGPNIYGKDIFALSADPNDGENIVCKKKACASGEKFNDNTCACEKNAASFYDTGAGMGGFSFDGNSGSSSGLQSGSSSFGGSSYHITHGSCPPSESAKCKGKWNSETCKCDCTDVEIPINSRLNSSCVPYCSLLTAEANKTTCRGNASKWDIDSPTCCSPNNDACEKENFAPKATGEDGIEFNCACDPQDVAKSKCKAKKQKWDELQCKCT